MRCRFVPRPQWPMSILSSRTAGKPSLRGRFHLAQWTLSPECRKRSIRLNLAQCSALVVEKRQDQQQHGQHGDRDHTYTVPNFFAHPSYVPEWGDDSNARDGKPDRRLLCQENYGVWTGPPTLELKYGRQYRRNAALAGPIPRTLRPRSSHEGSGRLRRGRGAQGRDGPHRQQILLFQILTDPSSLGFVPQSCASSIVLIARFDHGQSKEHQANNCNSSRDSYALQYSHGEASTKLRRIAKATRTTPRKSPLVSSNATNAIARA